MPPPHSPTLAQLAILPLNGLGGAAAFEAAAAAASAASDDAPFTSAAFDEAEAEASERRLAAAVLGGAPFIVDLSELRAGAAGSSGAGGSPAGFGAVADVAFLHGYGYAPALALLEHRVLTSASRLGSAAHTAVLSVVALDAAEARVTPVWGRDGLPHDCFGLVPVPAPAGASPRSASPLPSSKIRGGEGRGGS